MSAKTMAEVIRVVMGAMGCDRRAHYGNVEQPFCGKHGHYGQWPCPDAMRIADALTAAGFGLVADAKAEALDSAAADAEGMHDPAAPDCKEWADWLRVRAAEMRNP